MKKLTLVAAMTAAALGATAGAQTWRSDDSTFSYTFQGCKDSGSNVECTVSVSYVGDKDAINADICTRDMIAVLSTGESVSANYKRFGTQDWISTCDSTDIYKGVPLKVVAQYRDRSIKSIARFNYYGKVLGVNAVAPTPSPAPAAPVNVNLSDYNAALTGCKTTGSTITCTGAVLTPKR